MLTLFSAGPGLFYLAMAAAAAHPVAPPARPYLATSHVGSQVVQAASNCVRACRSVAAADLAKASRSDLSAPGE